MPLWFAIVLGVLQGLTEFLPISSTAHLRLAPVLLGQDDPGAPFTAVLQLGTLAAVLLYFRRDLFIDLPRAMIRAPRSPRGRLPLYLVAGTIPIVVAGLAGKSLWEGDARSLWVVAIALLVVALIMIAVDRGNDGHRFIDELALADVLWIGVAQAMALVPGVSRSGATICAALYLGLRRSDAARFSFLLGIPAIAGAGVLELPEAIRQLGDDAVVPLVVGTLVSAVVGYVAIAWLLRYLARKPLTGFAAYRIVLGVILIGLLAAAVVDPMAGTPAEAAP